MLFTANSFEGGEHTFWFSKGETVALMLIDTQKLNEHPDIFENDSATMPSLECYSTVLGDYFDYLATKILYKLASEFAIIGLLDI